MQLEERCTRAIYILKQHNQELNFDMDGCESKSENGHNAILINSIAAVCNVIISIWKPMQPLVMTTVFIIQDFCDGGWNDNGN